MYAHAIFASKRTVATIDFVLWITFHTKSALCPLQDAGTLSNVLLGGLIIGLNACMLGVFVTTISSTKWQATLARMGMDANTLTHAPMTQIKVRRGGACSLGHRGMHAL